MFKKHDFLVSYSLMMVLLFLRADLGTVAEDGESIWGHRKQREEFFGLSCVVCFFGENAIEKFKKYMSCIQQGVNY